MSSIELFENENTLSSTALTIKVTCILIKHGFSRDEILTLSQWIEHTAIRIKQTPKEHFELVCSKSDKDTDSQILNNRVFHILTEHGFTRNEISTLGQWFTETAKQEFSTAKNPYVGRLSSQRHIGASVSNQTWH